MVGIYGYLTSWAIYLIAGTLCYVLFYKATGVIGFKPLANTLRAIMLVLIYTPWYVAADKDLMAPAVMVIMLDLITVGGDSFIRAMVPLLLALAAAVLLVWIVGIASAMFRKKQNAE
ncbi:MAG: hypothetical protein Q8M35_03055 [Pseudohongiella sp.]|nr:hypothetical protein [Pseudohongiella sp.]